MCWCMAREAIAASPSLEIREDSATECAVNDIQSQTVSKGNVFVVAENLH